MNFDFDDEQRAIKESAREMLASRYPLTEVRRLNDDQQGFTDEQWSQLSELGWPGIFVSEDNGGQGLGMVELIILQEELGYALAPTPFFSNACAGLVLQAAGSDAQRERWLGPLAAGELRGTLALVDDTNPVTNQDGRLSGAKIAVPDVAAAEFMVVAAGQAHYLVQAGAGGLTVEPQAGVDGTRKLFRLSFEGVEAEPLTEADGSIEQAYAAIAATLAAESTGVAQRAMEMAVAYAKDRKQFDRPIGAYQAVSHRCAQMLLEVEGARSATYYAAWALDHESESAPLAASMAKAYASEAGWRVASSALQVHGGIGFTWEHDLHFFLKRAKANAHAFGDARWHRSRVAELAGL